MQSGEPRSKACRKCAAKPLVTHGHCPFKKPSATYRIWQGMRDRCFNQKNRFFQNYGGRGITVCDRWRGSFENFLADMGPRPSAKHSIDRIDNDGNYEPGNCRWATSVEQNNNSRNCRMLSLNGETLSAAEWARRLGGNGHLLLQRIDKLGWPLERALTEPFGDPVGSRRRTNGNKTLTLNGETLFLGEWSARTGLRLTTINERLRMGWTAERALTTPARPIRERAA